MLTFDLCVFNAYLYHWTLCLSLYWWTFSFQWTRWIRYWSRCIEIQMLPYVSLRRWFNSVLQSSWHACTSLGRHVIFWWSRWCHLMMTWCRLCHSRRPWPSHSWTQGRECSLWRWHHDSPWWWRDVCCWLAPWSCCQRRCCSVTLSHPVHRSATEEGPGSVPRSDSSPL